MSASSCALLTVDGKPGAVQQLDRAIAMVAIAMGFTKDSAKPESSLILPEG